MGSELKPIKLWGAAGPNPPKVAIILEELQLPYETVAWPISDVKKPEYVAINPNGRLPSIQDPNTGLTLWESGAIVEYLMEEYDSKNHKLSFPGGSLESYQAKQWLYFQSTGQGPYYGQLVWFKRYHHETLPSAIERYLKEVHRVSSVLDTHLGTQKQKYDTNEPWLVGNKLSFADLSFVVWQNLMGSILSKDDEYDVTKYPVLNAWLNRLKERSAVAKVLDDVAKAQAQKKH